MGWFQSDKFSQIILVEICAFMEFFYEVWELSLGVCAVLMDHAATLRKTEK